MNYSRLVDRSSVIVFVSQLGCGGRGGIGGRYWGQGETSSEGQVRGSQVAGVVFSVTYTAFEAAGLLRRRTFLPRLKLAVDSYINTHAYTHGVGGRG